MDNEKTEMLIAISLIVGLVIVFASLILENLIGAVIGLVIVLVCMFRQRLGAFVTHKGD